MKFTKIKKLHIYFFYLFLFSIPFQTRKVFLTKYSFYSGNFTEYTTFFIYVSDIFLLLTLFFWLISKKDQIKQVNFSKLKNIVYKNKILTYLLLFLFLLILNLVFKQSYLKIEIFQFLKVLEAILLFLYVYFNLKKGKMLFNSLLLISFSGFVQGIIAIFQFTNQQSFFKSELLRKLTGESLIGANISGVAKFVFEGQKIVRPYGTFPHPNILGGFLIFTTLVTIFLYLESKRSYLSSKVLNFQLFNLYNSTKHKISQGLLSSLVWIVLIFVQVSALLITFSRISWVGFILAIVILFLLYAIYLAIVPRGTIVYNSLYNKVKIEKINKKSQDYSLKLKIKNIFLIFLNIFTLRFFKSKINLAQIYKLSLSFFSQKEKHTSLFEKRKVYFKFTKKLERIDFFSFLNNIKNSIVKWKELFIICFLLTFLIISNSSLIQARIGEHLISNSKLPNNYAISDRIFFNNVSRETISNNFIFGSGIGTYIFQINKYIKKNKIKQKSKPWQYQPDHNIYLLIASEIGMAGLLVFLLFFGYTIFSSMKQMLKPANNLYKSMIEIVPRETISNKKLNYFLLAIFISFLFIGLFDHYFWTLQQGRLMFWLVLGIILANCKKE